MAYNSFLFDVFLPGIFVAASYVLNNFEEHDYKIKKLSSRLEKLESSQDHELKK